MKYEAIIFELDGVICSTDEYRYLAWKSIADQLDIPFSRKKSDRLRGVSRMDSLEIVLEDYSGELSPAEKEALAEQKNERYKQYLAELSTADLSPEVSDTLRTLRGRGLKLAVGSLSKNTSFILQQLGLGNFFDAVSDGSSIARSKPDPEVFLKVAEMLDTAPGRCLVVEDAISGAQAGHAVGMEVACVGDASTAKAGDYNLSSFIQLLAVVQ